MSSSTVIKGPSSLMIAAACNGVCHIAYLGGYCAAKSPLGMEPLPLMVPKDPLRQSMGKVLMRSDDAPLPIGSDMVIMVNTV